MKALFIFMLCGLGFVQVYAQATTQLQAAQQGLGYTFLSRSDIGSSPNPALLAAQLEPSMHLSHQRRFALAALQQIGFGLCLPNTTLGAWGLNIRQFGPKEYTEQEAQLQYARALGKRLQIGLSVGYLRHQIIQCGAYNTYTTAVGVRAALSSQLTLGALWQQPFPSPWLGQAPQKAQLGIGIDIHPSPHAHFLLEVHQQAGQTPSIHVGVALELLETLELQIGGVLPSAQLTTGLCWHWNAFRLNIAWGYHAQLHATSSLTLSYMLHKTTHTSSSSLTAL